MMRTTATILIGLCIFILAIGCRGKEAAKEGGDIPVESPEAANGAGVPDPRGYMFEADPARIIPQEALPYITPPYKVYRFEEGDLNGDKLADFIVILVNPEDLESFHDEARLPVLFLIRQQNKQLQLALRHEKLLQLEYLAYSATHSADIMVDTTGRDFTVTYREQGGTASGVWQESRVHFTYSHKLNDWLLASIATAGGANSPGYWLEREAVREATERGDTAFLRRIEVEGFPFEEMEDSPGSGEEEDYTILTADDFGSITLSQFKMGDWVFEF